MSRTHRKQAAGLGGRQTGGAISGRKDEMDHQVNEAMRHLLSPLDCISMRHLLSPLDCISDAASSVAPGLYIDAASSVAPGLYIDGVPRLTPWPWSFYILMRQAASKPAPELPLGRRDPRIRARLQPCRRAAGTFGLQPLYALHPAAAEAADFRAAAGRGRDAGYPAPPAQTRAGALNAHGSYLGCLAS